MLNYTEGIFIKEGSHRFEGIVNINGINSKCYIASSSKLSNFINLKNKKVLLRKNAKKSSKTKFTLFAIISNNTTILLDLNYANRLIYNYLVDNKPNFLDYLEIKREHKFNNGYKSDITITQRNETIIIEAKTLLTEKEFAQFPTIMIKRSYTQLLKIKELLIQGNKVYYWLVTLNPNTKTIIQNNKNLDFLELLNSCKKLGLTLMLSNILWDEKKSFSITPPQIINKIQNQNETYCL